jgi:hypothetical protein
MTEMEAVLEERERRVLTLETDLDKLKDEMETLRSKVQVNLHIQKQSSLF